MPGLVNAMITGQAMFDKDDPVVQPVPRASGAPTEAEFNALVDAFNELLDQLKKNKLVKTE